MHNSQTLNEPITSCARLYFAFSVFSYSKILSKLQSPRQPRLITIFLLLQCSLNISSQGVALHWPFSTSVPQLHCHLFFNKAFVEIEESSYSNDIIMYFKVHTILLFLPTFCSSPTLWFKNTFMKDILILHIYSHSHGCVKYYDSEYNVYPTERML